MKIFFIGAWVLVILAVGLLFYSTFFIPLQRTAIGFTNIGLEKVWELLVFGMLFMITHLLLSLGLNKEARP